MIVNGAADERGVCVFSHSFISTGLLLCRPNSQAADFVLRFQLVIWLSTSVTGRGPEYGRVVVTCSGANGAHKQPGYHGPLVATTTSELLRGVSWVPSHFTARSSEKSASRSPHRMPGYASLFSAPLKSQPVETWAFKACFPTVTKITTTATLVWGLETTFTTQPQLIVCVHLMLCLLLIVS